MSLQRNHVSFDDQGIFRSKQTNEKCFKCKIKLDCIKYVMIHNIFNTI